MYFNFLRMELFRLLKRKSTFIILGVLLALTILRIGSIAQQYWDDCSDI